MSKKSAQIQIGFGVIAAGAFLIGAMTFAVNSYLKSGKAIERVSTVEGDIKGIRSEMKGMNDKLDMLTDYFKLTPDNRTIK